MVDFNKTPNPTSDPSYLGLSQGTDRPQANRTFGSLFEGIGATVSAGIQAKDQENLQGIKEELYSGIDSIRDSQGITTVLEDKDKILHPSTRDIPEGVSNATAGVNRLTEAYAAGKISDTSYWAKVESLVRSTRSKYPGYREEIDKQVASITGTTPANALRNSILQDLEKRERELQAGGTRWETWERQNADWVTLAYPDYWQKKAQGNAYNQNQVMARVGEMQANQLRIKNGKEELAYSESVGKLTEEQASSQAIAASENLVWQALDTAKRTTLSNGMTVSDAIDQAISTGKPLAPELQQELLGRINEMEAQIGVGLAKVYSDRSSGKSYSEYMRGNTSKLQEIRTGAMAPLTAIKQAIATGDLAVAKYYSNLSEGMTKEASATILKQSKATLTLAALGSIPGAQNVVPTLLSASNPEFLNQAVKDVTKISTMKMVTGEQNIDQALADVDRVATGEGGANSGAANKAVIDNTAKLLQDPKTTDTAFSNLAKGVYRSDFLSNVESPSRDTQLRIFQAYASPAVNKKMETLKSSDPETYASYSRWVMKNSAMLFRSEFSQLAQGINTVPYLKVEYDPKTQQFTSSIPPASQRELEKNSFTVGSVFIGGQIEDSRRAIKNVNEIFNVLKPILQNSGQNPEQILGNLLRDQGVDPNAKKQKSLLGSLHRAITGGLAAASTNANANTLEGKNPVNLGDAIVEGWNSDDPTNQ